MKQHCAGLAAALAVLAGLAGSAGLALAQDKTLTVWIDFADRDAVRAFFRDVRTEFERENPDFKLTPTFEDPVILGRLEDRAADRPAGGRDHGDLEPDLHLERVPGHGPAPAR